jgi:hypothetical protein
VSGQDAMQESFPRRRHRVSASPAKPAGGLARRRGEGAALWGGARSALIEGCILPGVVEAAERGNGL